MGDAIKVNPIVLKYFSAEYHPEKAIERQNAAKVMRRFANLLKAHGYSRRSTWFSRESGHLIFFIHAHKYTFGPSFRLHAGIRVLNDPSTNVCLNGIASDTDLRYRNHLQYDKTEDSWELCATQMANYVAEVAEQWFKEKDIRTLLTGDQSLTIAGRVSLQKALDGESHLSHTLQSRQLLGLA